MILPIFYISMFHGYELALAVSKVNRKLGWQITLTLPLSVSSFIKLAAISLKYESSAVFIVLTSYTVFYLNRTSSHEIRSSWGFISFKLPIVFKVYTLKLLTTLASSILFFLIDYSYSQLFFTVIFLKLVFDWGGAYTFFFWFRRYGMKYLFPWIFSLILSCLDIKSLFFFLTISKT